jgi:hypothetical protein
MATIIITSDKIVAENRLTINNIMVSNIVCSSYPGAPGTIHGISFPGSDEYLVTEAAIAEVFGDEDTENLLAYKVKTTSDDSAAGYLHDKLDTGVGLNTAELVDVQHGDKVEISNTINTILAETDVHPTVYPGDNRILYWHSKSGYWDYLSIGSGLNIVGNTLNASGNNSDPLEYRSGIVTGIVANTSTYINFSSSIGTTSHDLSVLCSARDATHGYNIAVSVVSIETDRILIEAAQDCTVNYVVTIRK